MTPQREFISSHNSNTVEYRTHSSIAKRTSMLFTLFLLFTNCVRSCFVSIIVCRFSISFTAIVFVIVEYFILLLFITLDPPFVLISSGCPSHCFHVMFFHFLLLYCRFFIIVPILRHSFFVWSSFITLSIFTFTQSFVHLRCHSHPLHSFPLVPPPPLILHGAFLTSCAAAE